MHFQKRRRGNIMAKKGRQNKVSQETANPNVSAHAQDTEFASEFAEAAKKDKRKKK
jgi:hypothetical protein